MEPWPWAQGAFAVKAADTFVIAQREFRREFGIHRNRAVPSAHTFKTWVQNFEATGSTLKKNFFYSDFISNQNNYYTFYKLICWLPGKYCPNMSWWGLLQW
jgi:hypothetical protein